MLAAGSAPVRVEIDVEIVEQRLRFLAFRLVVFEELAHEFGGLFLAAATEALARHTLGVHLFRQFVVVAGDENWYVLNRTDQIVDAEYSAETPRATGNGRLFVADGSQLTAYALAADPEGGVERSEPTRVYDTVDDTRTTVYGQSEDGAPDDTASFCPQCGEDVTDADETNFCSACGTGLPDGANFCPECGADVAP